MASMVASGNRDGQSLVLKGVDPETCMIVFKNHWAQVNANGFTSLKVFTLQRVSAFTPDNFWSVFNCQLSKTHKIEKQILLSMHFFCMSIVSELYPMEAILIPQLFIILLCKD